MLRSSTSRSFGINRGDMPPVALTLGSNRRWMAVQEVKVHSIECNLPIISNGKVQVEQRT